MMIFTVAKAIFLIAEGVATAAIKLAIAGITGFLIAIILKATFWPETVSA